MNARVNGNTACGTALLQHCIPESTSNYMRIDVCDRPIGAVLLS
jgi:hypothetical protein